jgi:hypothetical protein
MKNSRLPRPMRRQYRMAILTALLIPCPLALLAQETDAEPAAEEAQGAEETEEAEETVADLEAADDSPLLNWVELGFGGTFTDGSKGAFQQRSGLPRGAYGGVESFHYEREITEGHLLPKGGTLKLDGRGIFDNHDYSLSLELDYPEKGYFKAGYTEYRTWYNGNGGYYPPTEAWFEPEDETLAIDRGALWFEGGLRLPNWPELTLRYERLTRDGQKDSLAWGESASAAGRRIVPAFWDIDEVRDIFALDARHTLGTTALRLGVRYEAQDQTNRQYTRRNPGEAADRRGTQENGLDSDLFNVHASAENWVRENVLFTVGYSFTDLDSDLSGYRVFGVAYDPDLGQRLPDPNTYQALNGGSQMSQHVANLNLMFLPWESFAVIPSARIEKQDLDSVSNYGQPAQPLVPSQFHAASERGLLDVSEALELRYTGVTNWVFFARGAWLQGQGDLDETFDNRSTATSVLARSTDDDRMSQKYAAGANWYPHRRFNLGGGYYYKRRNNDFDHTADSSSNAAGSLNRYPAFIVAQDFETHDLNAKATWRPLNNLTLVGRYDYQISTTDSRGDNLDRVESAETTSHILGASVSWVPWHRLYLQGSLNYVTDQTDTPVDNITQAVLDAENDYWNGSLTAGLALDDKTDLTATYFYYRADNYSDNSAAGLPYGVGIEEQGVTAGLSRQLSRRVRWTLRYGFFTSDDETSGGNNDYDAHLVYSTLQYRF